MNPALRQSLSARVAAVGLIAFIFCGNFWAGYVLLHSQPPIWIVYGFVAGLAVAAVAAVGLLVTVIYWRINPAAMPLVDGADGTGATVAKGEGSDDRS